LRPWILRHELTGGHEDRGISLQELGRRAVIDALGCQLRRDPLIDPDRADALDVPRARAEGQAAQHVRHLLVGRLFAELGGYRDPRGTGRPRRCAREQQRSGNGAGKVIGTHGSPWFRASVLLR
jgi:hypothetical protein